MIISYMDKNKSYVKVRVMAPEGIPIQQVYKEIRKTMDSGLPLKDLNGKIIGTCIDANLVFIPVHMIYCVECLFEVQGIQSYKMLWGDLNDLFKA